MGRAHGGDLALLIIVTAIIVGLLAACGMPLYDGLYAHWKGLPYNPPRWQPAKACYELGYKFEVRRIR